tara:strand:- start:65 stop:355 length:291 start_codon:yes stop_codon:yes gene_type:complete
MSRATPQEGLSGTFSPFSRQVLPVQARRCARNDSAGTSKQRATTGLAAAPGSALAQPRDARSDGPFHMSLPQAAAINILMHLPVRARPHCFQGKQA